MLDRKRSKVGIRHKVGVNSRNCEQPSRTSACLSVGCGIQAVSFESHARTCSQASPTARGYPDARVRRRSSEAKQACPGQADTLHAVQPAIKPVLNLSMIWISRDMRVKQKIDVDQDHLKASPSAMAKASAALVTSIRGRPRSTDFVRNGAFFLAVRHIPDAASHEIIDEVLKAHLTLLAHALEFSGNVRVKFDRRSHASKHIIFDALMSREQNAMFERAIRPLGHVMLPA